MNSDTNTNNEDMCFVDSATTHTILKNKIYFSNLVNRKTDVSTISDTSEIIEGSKRVKALLCGGTILHIDNALYSHKSQRNLFSFKDILLNEYHIERWDDRSIEYICIIKYNSDRKCVMEKATDFFLGLVLHLY